MGEYIGFQSMGDDDNDNNNNNNKDDDDAKKIKELNEKIQNAVNVGTLLYN